MNAFIRLIKLEFHREHFSKLAIWPTPDVAMLNRSNIEEANKHLQALYGRVAELEHVVGEQHEALVSKDSFIQTKVNELAQQDALIHRLTLQLREKESVIREQTNTIDQLRSQLHSSKMEIHKLNKHKETLDKVTEVIPEFKSVFSRLETVISELDEAGSEGRDQDGNQTSIHSADDAGATCPVQDGVVSNVDVSDSGSSAFVQDGESTTQQILRSFSRNERLEKFSISEDDDLNKDEDRTSAKELYF